MKNTKHRLLSISIAIGILFLGNSCNKKDGGGGSGVVPPPPPPPAAFDINSITDTYDAIAPFVNYTKWSVYNVHDPSIKNSVIIIIAIVQMQVMG